MSDLVRITVGTELFQARLQRDLAPASCGCLVGLLPYTGKLVHARWSGEALWAPLAPVFPAGLELSAEHPLERPQPGEILLYSGALSEPELYVPYGPNRFACKAGVLRGNPVLHIEERLERLAELGREAPWKGALELRIEVLP